MPYDALGISAHHYRLSLRGDTAKYAGDTEMWDRGEEALAEVLDRRGLPFESGAGEGAADQSLQRPLMIHRSIVGSLERLVAHLTEVHAGAFPTWMAPVQVVVLPVTCQQVPAAASLMRRLTHAGLRAEISGPDRGTLGARIRNHRLVPYQAIVAARETDSDTVSLRLRTGLALDPISVRDAADHIRDAAEMG